MYYRHRASVILISSHKNPIRWILVVCGGGSGGSEKIEVSQGSQLINITAEIKFYICLKQSPLSEQAQHVAIIHSEAFLCFSRLSPRLLSGLHSFQEWECPTCKGHSDWYSSSENHSPANQKQSQQKAIQLLVAFPASEKYAKKGHEQQAVWPVFGFRVYEMCLPSLKHNDS